MDSASARPDVRAPRRHGYDPKRELFGWMCIQAVSAGLAFAGVMEASRAGHDGWEMLLTTLMAAVLYNYFWCAWTLASWWGE